PLEDLVERDAAFESSQSGAETEVDAVAEREALADVAMDVEPVAVGKSTIIAVGRADQEDHDAALRHRLAVVLDVPADVSGDVRRRRLVPEDLLDRVRDQRAVLDELPPLVDMVTEHLARPADQSRGRLVARAGNDVDVREHLIARQAPSRAGLVLELGAQQLGHEIV